jgi:uncharacterized membrane protein
MKSQFARWQANFYTGLAIVLPAVISIAVVTWLFGTISTLTDPLLVFLSLVARVPKRWIYDPSGVVYWWWSLFALLLAIGLITLVGRLARHYIGKKLIHLVDVSMLQVPLLNKIYGAIKQVNAAFTTNNKSSFKHVVMIEFPRQGLYSVGFITNEQHQEVQYRTKEKVVSVFVPTTPNPTTGFLILVSEKQITKLNMTVADGIKFIISLGTVAPPFAAPPSELPLDLDQSLPAPRADLLEPEAKV